MTPLTPNNLGLLSIWRLGTGPHAWALSFDSCRTKGQCALLYLLFHGPFARPPKLNIGPFPCIYSSNQNEVYKQKLTPLDGGHLDSPFFPGSELEQTNICLETYPKLWQPLLSPLPGPWQHNRRPQALLLRWSLIIELLYNTHWLNKESSHSKYLLLYLN